MIPPDKFSNGNRIRLATTQEPRIARILRLPLHRPNRHGLGHCPWSMDRTAQGTRYRTLYAPLTTCSLYRPLTPISRRTSPIRTFAHSVLTVGSHVPTGAERYATFALRHLRLWRSSLLVSFVFAFECTSSGSRVYFFKLEDVLRQARGCTSSGSRVYSRLD